MTETAKEAARRFATPMLKRGYEPKALHPYTDRDGNVLFYRPRLEHPDTGQKWIRPLSLDGDHWQLSEPCFQEGKPLYRLHEVVASTDVVYWVEGEKTADALAKLGFLATTSGSCTSDETADFFPLAGRKVVIWPDYDDKGLKHGDRVAKKLLALDCEVQVLDVASLGLQKRADVVDWLALHPEAGKEDIEALPVVKPLPVVIPQSPKFPTLDETALYGLPGQIVKAIGPQSEADPAALLFQLLVGFGALVGRGPHFRVEGDEHHPNLFGVLVGKTGKGRKGTSWGRIHQILQQVPDFPKVVSGLSSGEGLKYHVRDPLEKKNKDGAMEIVDHGVEDKRLLVKESEFASVLKQASRPGNTLSPTVRESWDSGCLINLTKNDPIKATNAHICIVGHITQDELKRELTSTDCGNGFANRFLFVCTQRSKFLPFGGDIPEELISHFAKGIDKAAAMARYKGRIKMTEAAMKVWEGVYPELSGNRHGLFGSVTGRAEPQVIRLALVYALFDQKAEIEDTHLFAALAMWEYCQASAAYIFGTSLGDPVADQILHALKQSDSGMTRTDISRLFSNHHQADRLNLALAMLEEKGLATKVKSQTGGKPLEVWKAT